MSTLGELLAEHTMLPGAAVDHLHAVVGEWQLLAALSFADYLMWVRRVDGALVCVAQCRPNTSPTVLLTDAVGTVAGTERLPQLIAAFESGTIGEGEPAAGVEAVPVRHGDAVVAGLTHQTAVAARRKSSPLEAAYLDCANDLQRMLAEGTFPNVGDLPVSRSSPRVGDGFIRLDVNGNVVFASPNAISAYHRMGLTSELEGHHLVIATRPLISDPFEAHELAEHIRDSLTCGASMRLEVDAGGAAVLMSTLPLVGHGGSVGAAVLIRDVTEIKRRDRALLSKDATIREIHHRVKNNLQTVAALLRLQARQPRGPRGLGGVGAAGVVHRAGARRAVDVGRRRGEPRRSRGPDPADHGRSGRRRITGPGPPEGHSRRARCRPRDRIDHGDHRARPERHRARLQQVRNARERDDPGRTLGALARRRRARRRARAARRIQPGEVRPAGAADREHAGGHGTRRLTGHARRARWRNRRGAAGTDRQAREDRAVTS